MKTPQAFVDALSAVTLSDAFNPYSDICAVHDQPDAAARRRQNLLRCLEAAVDVKTESMWIARDLGYRGGRRTGLPLTDEAHLSAAASLFGGVKLERATQGPAVAERTATITWQLLVEINQPIFLWNVFPLHPHGPDDPMSNRCHRKAERNATWHFLETLLELVRPKQLVAIGRDAGNALANLDMPVETVRHPSYGGQAEFVSGIRTIYGQPADARIAVTPDLPSAEFA